MEQGLLKDLKKQLEQEKFNLMQTINHIDDGGLGVSLSESMEELSTYDQHPADVGTGVFERSKDFALREDAMLKVQAIEHARQRMVKGTYGICEVCGEEIPFERLQAVPYTTQCVQCRARVEEPGYRKNVRPVEEDVLEPPFARTFNDDADVNGYDGEDAWQDVARWQEHSPLSGAGAYYGSGESGNDGVSDTDLIDHIPYEVDSEGNFYESTRDIDGVIDSPIHIDE
ncbi:General stress protein 16O [Sporotomaculum syntrophicum]|uniref:General stress protein 16O n=1 Tax=Sporotomaculum syntrophicum TaxID=182264 RepID=A0A9D2WNN1_9FIRM|nr:TraR/DksA C4-type zinc finger protein [Sporotomaculum syntrophicum]KAF1084529.1 General stress protein 16O [Sporotomaculum syntrophicum]